MVSVVECCFANFARRQKGLTSPLGNQFDEMEVHCADGHPRREFISQDSFSTNQNSTTGSAAAHVISKLRKILLKPRCCRVLRFTYETRARIFGYQNGKICS